jgi:hypothetical protein
LPFFDAALDSFATGQPNVRVLESELKSAGFCSEVTRHSSTFSLEKNQWYYLLRKRFMSHLQVFTDQDIERGIKELEQRYAGRQIIEVRDTLLWLKCAVT